MVQASVVCTACGTVFTASDRLEVTPHVIDSKSCKARAWERYAKERGLEAVDGPRAVELEDLGVPIEYGVTRVSNDGPAQKWWSKLELNSGAPQFVIRAYVPRWSVLLTDLGSLLSWRTRFEIIVKHVKNNPDFGAALEATVALTRGKNERLRGVAELLRTVPGFENVTAYHLAGKGKKNR